MNLEVFHYTGDLLDLEIAKRTKKSEFNAKNHKTWYSNLDRFLDRKYSKWSSNAKGRGLKFTLSREQIKDMYILQNGLCPGFGVEMGFSQDDPHKMISMDQIVPGNGYTLENVWLTSVAFNYMKNRYNLVACGELLNTKTDLYVKVLDDYINHRPFTHNSDLLLV